MKNQMSVRKNALVEKLKTLRSEPQEKSSPTEFNFFGLCGKEHLIETNLDKKIYGINAGQFFERILEDGLEKSLFITVGFGDGCSASPGKFIWVLEEHDNGVSYWSGASTLKELKDVIGILTPVR